jgi:hypothetical protein
MILDGFPRAAPAATGSARAAVSAQVERHQWREIDRDH